MPNSVKKCHNFEKWSRRAVELVHLSAMPLLTWSRDAKTNYCEICQLFSKCTKSTKIWCA